MATTVTVTSPASGVVLYSWNALAVSDVTDAIPCHAAKRILVQFTGGTFSGSQINLQVSLDGTTWLPMYEDAASTTNGTIGNTTPAAVLATAAGIKIYSGQPAPFVRVEVTGGTGSALQVRMMLYTL